MSEEDLHARNAIRCLALELPEQVYKSASTIILSYIERIERERDDLLNPYTLTGWAKIRITELEAENARLQAIVDEQAEDEGLWFVAETAPEAYLQQELRRLHAAIDAARKP